MEGDISEMLRQVMSNPQFGAMVQAVKTQMGGDGEEAPDPAKIMEKMPELLAALGPVMGTAGRQNTEDRDETVQTGAEEAQSSQEKERPAKEEPEPAGEKMDNSGLPPIMQQFFRPGSREKRNKLLSALKPYLSPARCTLIDRAMSAMQMGELLGTVMPQDHNR